MKSYTALILSVAAAARAYAAASDPYDQWQAPKQGDGMR